MPCQQSIRLEAWKFESVWGGAWMRLANKGKDNWTMHIIFSGPCLWASSFATLSVSPNLISNKCRASQQKPSLRMCKRPFLRKRYISTPMWSAFVCAPGQEMAASSTRQASTWRYTSLIPNFGVTRWFMTMRLARRWNCMCASTRAGCFRNGYASAQAPVGCHPMTLSNCD